MENHIAEKLSGPALKYNISEQIFRYQMISWLGM